MSKNHLSPEERTKRMTSLKEQMTDYVWEEFANPGTNGNHIKLFALKAEFDNLKKINEDLADLGEKEKSMIATLQDSEHVELEKDRILLDMIRGYMFTLAQEEKNEKPITLTMIYDQIERLKTIIV